jgi:hypothetical protein
MFSEECGIEYIMYKCSVRSVNIVHNFKMFSEECGIGYIMYKYCSLAQGGVWNRVQYNLCHRVSKRLQTVVGK